MQHARVIVIGGGIVGCSILYHLAKAGCTDALLIERNELTSGATWHAAGNVHTQSAYPALSALQAYSLRLYDGLADEVGQEVGSHVVGGFFLAQSKARMEEFKFLAGKFRALGIEYELVTPDEIRDRHPLIDTTRIVGGAWDPEEGYVDPYSVAMGLAAGARQRGARIVRGQRVESMARTSDGWRLDGAGQSWTCEMVVNAGGFWANDVANMVGARLPVTNMEHHYLVTDTMPEVVACAHELPMIRDTDSQYYMRQEGQGLLVGPWEEDCRAAWQNQSAPWDFGMELFEADLDRLEQGLSAAYERFPALNNAGIKRIVNGAISFAPDARPMIGPLPGVPDYFVACGFLGGITQAGGIGLALSQWMLDGQPEYDLSFIDVARFGDWTSREFARARTYEVFPRRYEIIYPHAERESGRGLKTSPVHQPMLDNGAVMGQVYGWERPLWFARGADAPLDVPDFKRPNWFATVGEECLAVANDVGLVDMTAYSKFEVTGPDAHAWLNHVCSAIIPSDPGRVALTLLLTPRGGIVGDATVTCLGPGRYYIVGASLAEGIYLRWFEQQASGFDVRIEVATAAYGVLGLSGPKSRALLSAVVDEDVSANALPFMHAREVSADGVRAHAMRLSYAGELGFELHVPVEAMGMLFDRLMTAGPGCGLRLVGSRAMGMLRLEKGYLSWGNELTTDMTPAMVGLEWLCSQRKPYVGRQAVDDLRGQVPPKRLATLAVDVLDADCWGSEPVLLDDRVVGYVTSGGYGWRTRQSLAIAYMDSSATRPGQNLEVQVLGEKCAARVMAGAVYDPDNLRLRG